MKKRNILFAALLLSLIINETRSQAVTLKIGDQAPTLKIQKWIKGNPVNNFEPGKLYLIELSAVGCTPCRLAIPHLTEIAKKYNGQLQVISVYTMESDKKNTSDLSYVEKTERFISKMGDKIGYTVSADVPQQHTFAEWGIAAGLNGIPSSFLIDKQGKIAWFGYLAQDGNFEKIYELIDAALSNPKSLEKVIGETERNSQAMQAALDKIFLLKKENRMNEACKKMDSLIATSIRPAILYTYKFRLLSEKDDAKANECLQWILDHEDVGSFDWYHLINESYSLPTKPDFKIDHQIADRAIEQAETNGLMAYSILEKAHIYNKQGMVQLAIEFSSLALTIAKKDNADGTNASSVAYFENLANWYKQKQPR